MAQNESRHIRGRSIKRAISTSLISKGSTAVLQLVSLPLAARVLGREEFGIYATVSVSLYAVTVLQIGIGPALARGIAEAAARGDRERERKLYVTGAALVATLALAGVALAGTLLSAVPVETLFGEAYSKWEGVLVPALWTGVILIALDLIARHTDRIREGYMEASVANAWMAAGNFMGAVAVLVGIQFQPSVIFLLLAVYVPNILVRLANTVFLLRKRPWLISGPVRPGSWEEAKDLLKDGLYFSATTTIVHLVEFKLCALLVGRVLGPADVAIHLVLMSITTAFSGLLIMVGTPLWAAVCDARAREDHDWIRSATRSYYGYLAVLIFCAAGGLIVLGPYVLPLWYGSEFQAGRLLFAAHSVFLLAIGWRHVNRYVAIGLGSLAKTVAPILGGLALGVALAGFGLHTYGLAAMFLGLAAGTFVIPGWMLPRIVWRDIGRDGKDIPQAAFAVQ